MLTSSLADEKITCAHRAKLAYIYVRQSSPGQVRQYHESTELQYRLVERAVLLGWPRDRVHVIDDDLGKSGASCTDRLGFQHLMAEIGLGKAGLVLSLDASRLARNNRDWHQLLELCSLFGVLIADGEKLYEPRAYHDRLLLGLSGIMSEAELHQIRGQVWIRITWQTGAVSEHWLRRRVQDYRQYAEREQLEQRVRELNAAQKMDAEIAAVLNAEGFCSAQGRPFYGALVFLLRKQWRIPTVEINGTYQENPLRWPDGSYSVRGAAAVLQISPVTVFIWLRKGRFRAEQMAKGMPWKIWLTEEQIATIRANVRHVSPSKKEAL